MRKYVALIFIVCASLSYNCQENLKDFYYPFYKKTETRVYKYVDEKDPTKTEYWKITSNPETNEIKTVSFDSEFNIYNVFNEKITKKGAECIAYSEIEIKENGKKREIKGKILDKDVFKWNGDKKYSYSIKSGNKYGLFILKKTRENLGFTNIIVNGIKHKTIKFKDDYKILDLDLNVKQVFHQYTYYAKKIGMIKYERKMPIQKEPIVLELIEVLTEQEFEKIKNLSKQ